MKDIMARESSATEQGVPTFEYNPQHPALQRQGVLFELARPLDDLGRMLLEEFSGKTMAMNEVFQAHHVGRRYVKSNYKEALRQLEETGQLTAIPPAKERRKGTFADHVKATFA